MVAVAIVIFVPTVVVIFPHFVAVSVRLVSITISSYLPATVDPAIICVVVVPPPVVSVMVISDDAITEARVVAEARIVSEARFILPAPFPIFLLALTLQPIVLNVVIVAFRKPFPIVRIVVSVVAAGSAIRIWIVLIPMLRASGGQNRSRSQS